MIHLDLLDVLDWIDQQDLPPYLQESLVTLAERCDERGLVETSFEQLGAAWGGLKARTAASRVSVLRTKGLVIWSSQPGPYATRPIQIGLLHPKTPWGQEHAIRLMEARLSVEQIPARYAAHTRRARAVEEQLRDGEISLAEAFGR